MRESGLRNYIQDQVNNEVASINGRYAVDPVSESYELEKRGGWAHRAAKLAQKAKEEINDAKRVRLALDAIDQLSFTVKHAGMIDVASKIRTIVKGAGKTVE